MMKNEASFIVGDRLFLRGLQESDITDRYRLWLSDPETNQYLEVRHFPVSKADIEAYVRMMNDSRAHLFLGIFLKSDGRHIGNIKLGPINPIHRFADISILIGDKTCRRQGFAAEAIGLLTTFAFETLNLNRLSAGVYDGNTGSLKAFERIGFKQEGRLRGMRFFKGRFLDQIMLGLLREEYLKNGYADVGSKDN